MDDFHLGVGVVEGGSLGEVHDVQLGVGVVVIDVVLGGRVASLFVGEVLVDGVGFTVGDQNTLHVLIGDP